MRFPAVTLLVAVVGLVSSDTAPAQDTLKSGDVISGRLRLVRTQHPNGTRIVAYQIVSERPLAFAEPDEFCDKPPVTFHLVANDRAVKTRLDRAMGKKLAVVAEEFSCSHTAWHIGDAVVFKWRFAEPARR